jgi:peptidoglycan/xylan/chitin deacetylase (PgdA/CDA1 family)
LDLSSDATRRTSFKCLKNFIKTLPHVDAMALVDRLCDDLDLHTSEGHVLGWDDLRVLAREGVTLAAHTQTHPLLSRISTEMMRAEVAGSMCDIQRETGSVLPVFAYPSGDFDEQVVHVLRDAGVLLAFSTIEGGNDLLAVDPLRLRRMNVGQRSTLPIFRARLLQQSWFGSQWPH